MSDPSAIDQGMVDQGVVSSLRLPAFVQAWVHRIRAWPRIAQAFAGLAILDIVARTIGVIPPPLYVSLANPVTLATGLLPHDALILLPAVIVLRRADAETATPWLLRGAVVLALQELLWAPTASITADLTVTGGGAGNLVFWFSAIGAIVRGLGWLCLGLGLERLNPVDVRAPIAGLANVAMWLVAGTAFFSLLGIVMSRPQIDFDPERSGAIALTNSLVTLALLGYAYFVRAVLRGLEDPSRPLVATRLAAIGVVLTAALGLCTSFLGVFAVASFPFATQLLSAVALPFSLLGDVAGYVLVVIAFGVGFGDPLRPMAKDWAAVADTPA